MIQYKGFGRRLFGRTLGSKSFQDQTISTGIHHGSTTSKYMAWVCQTLRIALRAVAAEVILPSREHIVFIQWKSYLSTQNHFAPELGVVEMIQSRSKCSAHWTSAAIIELLVTRTCSRIGDIGDCTARPACSSSKHGGRNDSNRFKGGHELILG